MTKDLHAAVRRMACCFAALLLALAAAQARDLREPRPVDSGRVGNAEVTCPEPDLQVTLRHPISGYWVLGEFETCEWRSLLQRIHKLGADTVIQFGGRLTQSSLVDLDRDPVFKQCREEGEHCAVRALSDLRSIAGERAVRGVYSFRSPGVFGKSFVRCPSLDRRIESGDLVFWRLVIPVRGRPGAECEAARGSEFDMVIVVARRRDSLRTMLEEAGRFRMRVFVGMPMAAHDPARPWTVDPVALPLSLALSERVFRDLAERFASTSSLHGLYQSFEISVTRNPLPAVLSLYERQHALAGSILPGKKVLVSPYWSSRLKPGVKPDTPADVAEGIGKIAATGVHIVAPQDGGGTGKVGRFNEGERKELVEPRLRRLVGDVRNDQAYGASTADFYRAARMAVDQAKATTQRDLELWANVEAFDPTPGATCGGQQSRSRTTKEALEKGVQLASPFVNKIVSYMWNPFFTCVGGQPAPLADEIEKTPRK